MNIQQLCRRDKVGILSIAAVVGLLMALWLLGMSLSERLYNFQETLRSIGQATALLGITLIAINIMLSGRFKRLESFFGGMDKMYILHHILGGIGFILVLLHPIFIAGAYYLDSPMAASNILLPGPNLYKNLGNISLILFMTLIVLTLFVKLPYEIWHKTHKVMGVAFLLGGVHAFFMGSDIRANAMLRAMMLLLILGALSVYVYRTLLGRWLVSRYRYKIKSVHPLSKEVTQIILSTKGERLRFVPGQFAFFTFSLKNGKQETHPFSISSSNQSEELIITAKALGDFTAHASSLKIDSVVWVEGPYGKFLSDTSGEQVWIAGGIGVTPFVSRILSGLHNYQHVDFFYTASEANEMVYTHELINQSQQFKQLKLHFHATKEKGRLTVDGLTQSLKHIKKRTFYLCGPIAMMTSLREHLIQAGVPDQNIFLEQFSIDERS